MDNHRSDQPAGLLAVILKKSQTTMGCFSYAVANEIHEEPGLWLGVAAKGLRGRNFSKSQCVNTNFNMFVSENRKSSFIKSEYCKQKRAWIRIYITCSTIKATIYKPIKGEHKAQTDKFETMNCSCWKLRPHYLLRNRTSSSQATQHRTSDSNHWPKCSAPRRMKHRIRCNQSNRDGTMQLMWTLKIYINIYSICIRKILYM